MLMFFLVVLWLVVIIGWLVLRERIAAMDPTCVGQLNTIGANSRNKSQS